MKRYDFQSEYGYGEILPNDNDGVYVVFEDADKLRAALEKISNIKDKYIGADWDEIEEARFIAEQALKDTE